MKYWKLGPMQPTQMLLGMPLLLTHCSAGTIYVTLTYDPMTFKRLTSLSTLYPQYLCEGLVKIHHSSQDLLSKGDFQGHPPWPLTPWPWKVNQLIKSLIFMCEVWCKSVSPVEWYCRNRIIKVAPLWPWPLTPWPWQVNQFMYSLFWICVRFDANLPLQSIIIAQTRFSMSHPCDLDLWHYDLDKFISSSTLYP